MMFLSFTKKNLNLVAMKIIKNDLINKLMIPPSNVLNELIPRIDVPNRSWFIIIFTTFL